ncbi:2,4-dienoyl-CoA reductase-like NADH-dependent reductase (Old Yellow Enzyme family)/thioredoxin reductase [Azospirillum agricola]|uniref:oxidoreductase n=1 Tax=Azospirillum agricola TaxID=1720247 RepID=UPI001AEAE0B9|nr:FAD-dependent oxidoreductase [Azospirillum agricola]MBP2231669.1 2,4-dienoyl-CoA reductase-like NADH-dependent reductase (Old Yellow Enzyme family)/thioredoxin reductase [Azospirillum agricola]
MDPAFPHLFSPGRLRNLVLPNRLVMAPMESNMAAEDGTVSDAMLAYYAARAAGGVGMVIVEYACVDRPTGLGGAPQLGIDDDSLIASHRRLTAAIAAHGARSCLQLFHAGRQTLRRFTGGRAPIAPSPIACRVYREEPREITVPEIADLVRKFGDAAARAVAAGYDAVEIHGAHGYLIGGFLSGAANRRTDAYGGSLENRMRFPLAVVSAVRHGAGEAPVIVRLSAEEFVEGGTTLDEAERIAPRLVAAGADALHVSTGTAERMDRNVDPVSAPQGWRIPLASRIRAVAGVPVLTVGVIRQPDVAERAIADGSADFVALGRALLADPQWPDKARRGAVADIRPCTSCNWCVDQLLAHKRLGCAENPRAGRETEAPVLRSGAGRAAAVVGGGPGGMVAALLLQDAGFRVTLFEKADRLGLGLVASATPPGKDKFFWYRDYLVRRLADSGVELRLGAAATADDVLALRPALAVVATGAANRAFPLAGSASVPVGFAHDLLTGEAALGDGPVVIAGSGETGCECAEHVAESGRDVILVSRSPERRLARRAQYVYRRQLVARLESNPRIRIETGMEVAAVGDGRVVLRDQEGADHSHAAGQVLLALGRVPENGLAEALRAAGLPTHVIGDSREVGRIGDAVHDAYAAVRAVTRAEGGGRAEPVLGLAC